MVEETIFKNKKAYKCMKCGWLYRSPSFARQCEDYCKENASCNLELTRHAIKIKN